MLLVVSGAPACLLGDACCSLSAALAPLAQSPRSAAVGAAGMQGIALQSAVVLAGEAQSVAQPVAGVNAAGSDELRTLMKHILRYVSRSRPACGLTRSRAPRAGIQRQSHGVDDVRQGPTSGTWRWW